MYSERVDLLIQQNDNLRHELGLQPLPGHDRVNLDAIGFTQIDDQLILSGGSELGIQPGMPVINGEGLVAIVQTVSPHHCQAALLTAYGLQLGGIDVSRKPPELGLLKGIGATIITMRCTTPGRRSNPAT
jgi:cell shape-determining protein MreC